MLTTNVYVIESYEPTEFPNFSALYEEEQLHVECVAYGETEKCDYGVRGSPVWYEITDIEIDLYVINGVEYSRKDVRSRWGETVEKKLNEICVEQTEEKGEWS